MCFINDINHRHNLDFKFCLVFLVVPFGFLDFFFVAFQSQVN